MPLQQTEDAPAPTSEEADLEAQASELASLVGERGTSTRKPYAPPASRRERELAEAAQAGDIANLVSIYEPTRAEKFKIGVLGGVATAAKVPELAGKFAEYLGVPRGTIERHVPQLKQLADWGRSAEQAIKEVEPFPSQDLESQVLRGAGQMLPYAATIPLGGAAGEALGEMVPGAMGALGPAGKFAGDLAGAVLMGQTAVPLYEDVLAATGDAKKAWKAAFIGMGLDATEVEGLGEIFGHMAAPAQATLRHALTKIATGAAKEGAQEFYQELGQEVATQKLSDQDIRKLDTFVNSGRAGLIGWILGAGVGGPTELSAQLAQHLPGTPKEAPGAQGELTPMDAFAEDVKGALARPEGRIKFTEGRPLNGPRTVADISSRVSRGEPQTTDVPGVPGAAESSGAEILPGMPIGLREAAPQEEPEAGVSTQGRPLRKVPQAAPQPGALDVRSVPAGRVGEVGQPTAAARREGGGREEKTSGGRKGRQGGAPTVRGVSDTEGGSTPSGLREAARGGVAVPKTPRGTPSPAEEAARRILTGKPLPLEELTPEAIQKAVELRHPVEETAPGAREPVPGAKAKPARAEPEATEEAVQEQAATAAKAPGAPAAGKEEPLVYTHTEEPSKDFALPPTSKLGPVERVPFADIELKQLERFRNGVDQERVEALQKKMAGENPEALPPVTAIRKPNGKLQLLDGHHRVVAAEQLGFEHVPVRVVEFEKETDQQRLDAEAKATLAEIRAAPGEPIAQPPKRAADVLASTREVIHHLEGELTPDEEDELPAVLQRAERVLENRKAAGVKPSELDETLAELLKTARLRPGEIGSGEEEAQTAYTQAAIKKAHAILGAFEAARPPAEERRAQPEHVREPAEKVEPKKRAAPLSKADEEEPSAVNAQDIPDTLATAAFAHTSHTPEKRGAQIQQEYVEAMREARRQLAPLATDADKLKLLTDELEKYRQGYLTRVRNWLAAHSRVASAMITGPANFPVEQNRKRGAIADKRRNDLLEFQKRGIASIRKALTKDERAAAAEERYPGRVGREVAFDGGRVVLDKESDRVRVFFDEKPDGPRRRELISAGFKWSPSVGAWQRQWTENAELATERLLGVKLTVELTPEQLAPDLPPDEGETIKEVPPAESPQATGIKNAAVARELEAMGLPLPEKQERVSFAERHARAKDEFAKNPLAGARVVDALEAAPRPPSAEEGALLAFEANKLISERDAAESAYNADPSEENQTRIDRAREAYARFGDVMDRAGYESSVSLGIRRMMIARDYSLAAMERSLQVAKGGAPLTADESAKARELHEKLSAAEKALAEHVRQSDVMRAELEAQNALLRLKKNATREGRKGQRAAAIAESKLRIDELVNELAKRSGRARAGLDTETLGLAVKLAIEHLRIGYHSFAQWAEEMVARIGEHIRPYLKPAWDEAQGEYEKQLAEPVSERLKGGEPLAELGSAVQQIAEHFVAQGIVERERLIDAVHAVLVQADPAITRRETMDAISGYGVFRRLSSDEVKKKLRDLKGQMQQVAKIEELEKGIPPKKSGVEHRAPSDEERRLIQKVNDLKRRLGVRATDPESQLRSALDQIKTRLRNQIADIQAQLDTRTPLIRSRAAAPTDPDVEALRARRDTLQGELDVLFKDAAEERQAELAMRAVEKSIADLERRIAAGDLAPKGAGAGVSTPELEAARARRDALQEELELLRAAAKPTEDPEAKRQRVGLQAYKTRKANEIARLRERTAMRQFVFGKRPEIQLDKQALALKSEHETARRAFEREKERHRLKNRSRTRKLLDAAKEVVNLPKAVMTAWDFSAVLRQGAFFALGHPVTTLTVHIPRMLKAALSERSSLETDVMLRNRPLAAFGEASKLDLTRHGDDIGPKEEAIRSQFSDYIPGLKASNRAFITFLNLQRAFAFDAMVGSLPATPTIEQGRVIANAVNVATGRGQPGRFAGAISALAIPLWSPRLLLSRLQLLAGQPLYRGDAATRVRIAKEYARFLIGMGAVYAIAKLAGGAGDDDDDDVTIETDPRSSDFGKIKIGTTRIDPLAGLSQVTVLISRLASGATKRLSGQVVPLRGDVPYGGDTSADVIGRFLRSKLSPTIGVPLNVLSGENMIGEPVTPGSVAKDLLVPLSFQDIQDAMRERGVPQGAALGILSIFGAGLQTYGEKLPEELEKFRAEQQNKIEQLEGEPRRLAEARLRSTLAKAKSRMAKTAKAVAVK